MELALCGMTGIMRIYSTSILSRRYPSTARTCINNRCRLSKIVKGTAYCIVSYLYKCCRGAKPNCIEVLLSR